MAGAALTSCSDDDNNANTWEDYRQWREDNISWLEDQGNLVDEATGQPYYTKIVAPWAPSAYVLMHWFNDPAENGGVSPMLTSTVTTRYKLHLYDGTLADSSEGQKGGVFTSQLSSLIEGWQIAMMNMHVGDTVQILIPYQSAYGSSSSGSVLPYSALRFNVRLEDIPDYEIRP